MVRTTLGRGEDMPDGSSRARWPRGGCGRRRRGRAVVGAVVGLGLGAGPHRAGLAGAVVAAVGVVPTRVAAARGFGGSSAGSP